MSSATRPRRRIRCIRCPGRETTRAVAPGSCRGGDSPAPAAVLQGFRCRWPARLAPALPDRGLLGRQADAAGSAPPSSAACAATPGAASWPRQRSSASAARTTSPSCSTPNPPRTGIRQPCSPRGAGAEGVLADRRGVRYPYLTPGGLTGRVGCCTGSARRRTGLQVAMPSTPDGPSCRAHGPRGDSLVLYAAFRSPGGDARAGGLRQEPAAKHSPCAMPPTTPRCPTARPSRAHYCAGRSTAIMTAPGQAVGGAFRLGPIGLTWPDLPRRPPRSGRPFGRTPTRRSARSHPDS